MAENPKKKGVVKTVATISAHALLPTYAFKKIVETKDSLGRIGRMLKGERLYVPEYAQETEAERDQRIQDAKDAAMGRELVLSLEAHERFEYVYQQLGWDEQGIEDQKRMIRRSHTIRLCFLYLIALLVPAMIVKSGYWTLMYSAPMLAALFVVCLKSTCFYIQLQERALWSLSQLLARSPRRLWLLKRALWFLD